MYVLDGTPKGRNPTNIYVCMYIVPDGTAKYRNITDIYV
jgi:hypothetical protein